MTEIPFHYVDLRAFSYATEDEELVERALRTFLPEDSPVEYAETEGHYGDRILIVSARVENADGLRHVLDRIGDLEELDRVRAELDERVDEDCSLFLRLDKQAALSEEIRLGDGITLHAKVEAYPAKQDAAVENAREALSE